MAFYDISTTGDAVFHGQRRFMYQGQDFALHTAADQLNIVHSCYWTNGYVNHTSFSS